MIKIACLAVLVGIVAAQNNMMQYMMLNQMMGGGSRGGGGGSGASSGALSLGGMGSGMASMMASGMGGAAGGRMAGLMGGFMNNPMLLCKQTDNFQPIPCRASPALCQMQSVQTYKIPDLLKCSPMGFGCCIKDAFTLMFVQRLG